LNLLASEIGKWGTLVPLRGALLTPAFVIPPATLPAPKSFHPNPLISPRISLLDPFLA
jgi:hypothetical protein